MLNRRDILKEVRSRESFALGPVRLKVGGGSMAPAAPRDDEFYSTTSLWVQQGERRYEFVAEIGDISGVTPLGTPKALRTAAERIKGRVDEALRTSPSFGGGIRNPMIIAPYLSEKRLNELAGDCVSAVDLCGNGVLVAEGLFVFKTGEKNLYPQSVRLGNAYQGVSSLVGRAFMVQPEFESVNALAEFIGICGGRISLSQVSKVLKQMEEDLLISRGAGVIRAIQPDAILDALRKGYKSPRITERWLGRYEPESSDRLLDELLALAMAASGRVSKTGICSAPQYAGYGGEPVLAIYTDVRMSRLLDGLEGNCEEGGRFANLEIMETDSVWVYFGCGRCGGLAESSMVQAYLEMAGGDVRQQRAAEQIRERILIAGANGGHPNGA